MNIFKHLVAVGIFAAFTMSSAQDPCNPIDVVTMSTLKVVNTSKACATTATVDFTSSKTNGTRTFAYGTSTSYGKNVTLTMASTKRGAISLTGLTASTKYYYKVDNIWEGSNVYTLVGTFTTSGGNPPQPPVITSATAVSCTTGTTKTYTATATDPASKPLTFTYTGLPTWATANGAVLTMKPIAGSASTSVKVIATNGSAADTATIAITVVPTTSIKLTDMIRKTSLGIGVGNDNIVISLFSLNGALVYKKVMAPKSDIQVSKALSDMKNSGTYMCSIKSGNNEVRKLLTLQK